jgi:hypothetical protein
VIVHFISLIKCKNKKAAHNCFFYVLYFLEIKGTGILMKHCHIKSMAMVAMMLLILQAAPATAGPYRAKADWIAQKIIRLFSDFESHVAKEYNGKVYITTPIKGAYHDGAMMVIRGRDGGVSAYALIDDVTPKYAAGKILKRFGKIDAKNSRASGSGWPVRLLFVSGPGQNNEAAGFISDLEESLRDSSVVELAPADIGHFLLQKSMDGTPSTVPRPSLREAGTNAQVDYMALLTVREKESPADVWLMLVDRSASPILILNDTWPGVKKKKGE